MDGLKQFEKLVVLLSKDLSSDVAALGTAPEVFFTSNKRGLALWGDEAREYRETLEQLRSDLAEGRDISVATIRRQLNDAILYVIAEIEGGVALTDAMIREGVRRLKEGLEAPLREYQCYVPVRGIEAQDLPQRYGRVRFVVFNEAQLSKLRRLVREKHKVGVREKLAALARLRKEDLWEHPCAVLFSKARDERAALELARDEVALALDVLNFFSDLLPYNYAWLYMPSYAGSEVVTSVVVGSDSSFQMPGERLGSVGTFSIRRLKQSSQLGRPVSKIHRFLQDSKRTEVEELLLASVRWAGRATTERSRERAFLLYMIALEALILPTQENELGYRLRLRVAKLLGPDRGSRVQIAEEIASLYKIRSKIVHSGSFETTDRQLGQARKYAKHCILHALQRRSILQISKKRELHAWFERLTVS